MTEMEIRDVAVRGPLMWHARRLAPLGAPFDARFAPLQMDDHELSWRAWTALGLKSAYLGVSIHADRLWSHQRHDKTRPPATVLAEDRNWATLNSMYADELGLPPPTGFESRALAPLPDGAAPRIVATVGRSGEFAQLAKLVKDVRAHDAALVVHVADEGLTLAERAQAARWSRVVLATGRSGGGSTAARVISRLMVDRGGLILWIDPGVKVTDRLDVLFQSVTANGTVAAATTSRGCTDRVVGVNAAHARAVVDVTSPWLACAVEGSCGDSDAALTDAMCATIRVAPLMPAGLALASSAPSSCRVYRSEVAGTSVGCTSCIGFADCVVNISDRSCTLA